MAGDAGLVQKSALRPGGCRRMWRGRLRQRRNRRSLPRGRIVTDQAAKERHASEEKRLLHGTTSGSPKLFKMLSLRHVRVKGSAAFCAPVHAQAGRPVKHKEVRIEMQRTR